NIPAALNLLGLEHNNKENNGLLPYDPAIALGYFQRAAEILHRPNWEELLGGEFEKRARDRNFDNIQKEMYGQFENTFMMYLPRL
ncbi:hypothetical protein MJM59_33015, partial [Salmonella enterica subsp. enterica serovar Montevideo]|nr:hypothetical protein [Salmonella enterica subsp. enterica serovar Montevideo]